MNEMASSPEDTEILISLGLTRNAAKIFTALSPIEEAATAITISRASGVAREIVYQIMPSLIQKGLVEEMVTSPKTFKAIPIKVAYNMLLQQKKQENIKITKKVEAALKKKANHFRVKTANQFKTSIIASGGQQQHFMIHQEFEKVQKSLDMILAIGKFLQWSQHYAELDLEELRKKNVKMRLITEERISKWLLDSPEHFSPVISKLNDVNFRYFQKTPPIELIIFDKHAIFLSIKKEPNINKMRWLYSNNPFINKMTNSYFETQWENAKELTQIS